MERKTKLHPAIAALIVVVLVGIVASAVIVVNNNNKTSDTTASTGEHDHDAHSHETSDKPVVDSTDVSNYTDGTYTATGSYLSPGGRESIELTVTIKDGAIESTSMVAEASDAEAKEYQTLFDDHYKTLIVGKKVNGLSLSRVAGSSLTSNGFNDALDEIRQEART